MLDEELSNEGNKQLIKDILDVIMKDMGGIGAKRLMPKEVSVGIEAPDVSGNEESPVDMEGSPEEESLELPKEEEEEKEDISMLPRWKQRQKMGM